MYVQRIVFVFSLVACTAMNVCADMIDITLNSNPAYVSDELEAYLHYAHGSYEPLVGFDAVNIGDGKGNGIDEVVACSFVFQPLTIIDNAYLTIDLTPFGTSTDELLFADNMSIRGSGETGAKFYGNTRLEALRSGVRTSLTFDLAQMDYSNPNGTYSGIEDLRVFLRDGDFNVVYADDAIIHSARLRINTGFIELPPLFPPTPPVPPCNVPEANVSSLLMMSLMFTVLLMINMRITRSRIDRI